MIKNKIKHLLGPAAGAAALLAGVLLSSAVLAPAHAAGLRNQDSNYEWRLCPAGRLLPIRPGYTEAATDSDNTEIRADSSRLLKDGLNQFTGDVEVIRGDNALRAEVVNYDENTGIFTAEGRTHIWNSGLMWMGESAVYDLNSEVSSLYEGRYALLGGRGQGYATHIENDRQADVTILEDVEYSTCPLSDEAWRVSAARIKLDYNSDRGSATHAILRVRNIPVFYFPYVNFPISDKRKSGFLAPSFGTTNDSGFDVQIPYYWNIAPNYDATLTPQILTDRGGMMGGEFRYMEQTYFGTATGEYLPSDNLRDGQDRSSFSAEHTQYFDGYRGLLDVVFNNVSDEEYFEDFGGNIAATSQRFLDRRITYRHQLQRTLMGAHVQSYQTVDDSLPPGVGPYRILPSVYVLHSFAPRGPLEPSIFADTTYFRKDTVVSGTRSNVEPSLTYVYKKPYLDIRPQLSVKHTQYFLDDPNRVFDDNESRSIPTLSIDAKLFAERSFSLLGKNHLQTFEPRLFYLLTPKIGQENLPVFDTGEYFVSFQSIFLRNRFAGGDRVGDANQISAGVTSRVLDTDHGRELFHISFGQIYFFRDREVTLPGVFTSEDNQSEIIAEASASLGDDWNIRGTLQWDPNEPQTEKSAIALRYHPNLETVVNMSYRFRRAVTDIEQTDLSFRIPVLENVALIGRWNYSLPGKRTLEAVGGLEYESCCWGTRLVARRFLRNADGAFDTGIFVEFHLRGLGGFGQKSGTLLQRGIPGYEDPFN